MDWAGWEDAVLTAGGWPVTPENVRFLQEWHPYEESNCGYNPLNTTLTSKGSTNCVKTATRGVFVQNYISKASGAKATALTLKGPLYLNIAGALQQGDPYSYPASQAVADQIRTWGTPKYADFYLTQVAGAVKSGGTTTTDPALAAVGHRGYYDFRNSIARHLPLQLEHSRRTGDATLRLLAHRRRVRG